MPRRPAVSLIYLPLSISEFEATFAFSRPFCPARHWPHQRSLLNFRASANLLKHILSPHLLTILSKIIIDQKKYHICLAFYGSKNLAMKFAPEPNNKFLNLFSEFTTGFQVHIVPHINLEEKAGRKLGSGRSFYL